MTACVCALIIPIACIVIANSSYNLCINFNKTNNMKIFKLLVN